MTSPVLSVPTLLQPDSSPVTPPLLTAEEFFRHFGSQRFELVDGRMAEMPMPGFSHGEVAMNLAYELGHYVRSQKIGRMFINDTFILLKRNPDLVRGADLGFISYERLPGEQKPDGILEVLPELVIEIRSPSDSWTRVFTKIGEYLDAGIATVVVVDAVTKSVSVYRPTGEQLILTFNEEFSLPHLFPGWKISVAKLFE